MGTRFLSTRARAGSFKSLTEVDLYLIELPSTALSHGRGGFALEGRGHRVVTYPARISASSFDPRQATSGGIRAIYLLPIAPHRAAREDMPFPTGAVSHFADPKKLAI